MCKHGIKSDRRPSFPKTTACTVRVQPKSAFSCDFGVTKLGTSHFGLIRYHIPKLPNPSINTVGLLTDLVHLYLRPVMSSCTPESSFSDPGHSGLIVPRTCRQRPSVSYHYGYILEVVHEYSSHYYSITMAEQDGRPSRTPTIVSEGSDGHDINEEFQHRLFPGREGHEKDEHLVNFEPDDPLNPMVSPTTPIPRYS